MLIGTVCTRSVGRLKPCSDSRARKQVGGVPSALRPTSASHASFKSVAVLAGQDVQSRRAALAGIAGMGFALTLGSEPAMATPLAPLGPVGITTGDKYKLSLEELKDTLKEDLAVRQYFVTGNITQQVFADDCRFKDPTNDIVGLSRYVKALTILFDPENSSVVLLDIGITGPNTIESRWTLGGTLKLPWKPVIDRIEGHTIYTTNADGLVQIQEQEWSISPGKALFQTFNPF